MLDDRISNDGALGEALAEFPVQVGQRREVLDTPRVESVVELSAAIWGLAGRAREIFQLPSRHAEQVPRSCFNRHCHGLAKRATGVRPRQAPPIPRLL